MIVVELFTDLFLQTDGTTSLIYTDIDSSEVEDLGPYIESMYVLTSTVNRTSDHQWGVYASWSNTGRSWSTPTLIFAAGSTIAANGETIQGSYNTVANYGGRKLKIVAGCKNGSERLARDLPEDLTVPLPPDDKIRIFKVLDGTFATDGSTSDYFYEIEADDIEREGMTVESLQVLTVTENCAPTFSWAIFAAWQNRGRTWSTETKITSDIQANGETIEAEFTTLTAFAGRRMKLLLGVKNTSGSVRVTARLRAWLVVRYQS